MAELRSSTSIGGNVVWHSGNLRFDTQGERILYSGNKLFSEHDKPDPHIDMKVPVVKLGGDTMTGDLSVPNVASINTNLVYGFGGSTNGKRGSMQMISTSTEDVNRSGFVDFSSTCSDLPVNNSWFWGFHTEHNNGNGYGMTMGWSRDTNKMFWRGKAGGGYTAWEEIFSSRDYNTLNSRYVRFSVAEQTIGSATSVKNMIRLAGGNADTNFEATEAGGGYGAVFGYDGSANKAHIKVRDAGVDVTVLTASRFNGIAEFKQVPTVNGSKIARLNSSETVTESWNFTKILSTTVNPSSGNHLTRKSWVDGELSKKLNMTGGTLTGNFSAPVVTANGIITTSSASLQVNGFMRTGDIYIHTGGGTPTTTSEKLSNVSGALKWGSSDVLTQSNFPNKLDSRYVNATGDTITGTLTLNQPLKITSNGATLDMGSLNSSFCHFNTTASSGFLFADNLSTNGNFSVDGGDISLTSSSKIKYNSTENSIDFIIN
jgi:hypothetical protein